MSFPVVLDATAPADTETPQLGAARIRALVQDFLDLFTYTNGASISWAALDATKGIFPVVLTNKTGVALVAGNVVAIDSGNDTAVALGDTVSTLKKLAVAQASIANNASGPFVLVGRTTLSVQGTATRGNFFRKSATTLKVEDAGVAMNDTNVPAAGVQGVFTTADSGGLATGILFSKPAAASLETGTYSADLGPGGTAARAVNTEYQNTSGRKRRVYITMSGAGNALNANFATGSVSGSLTARGYWFMTATALGYLTQMYEVPSGHYYKLVNTTGTIQQWMELDE